MTKAVKTLLVGLDAACWEYVRPLLSAGQLPAMARLMKEGVSGVLQSTMPALTPVAWSSIATGKNPGQHGFFDMTYRQPNTTNFLPVNANLRAGTPFWKRLNEQGIRVGLMNVPFTYPPDKVKGFVVCGFGTPSNTVPDVMYPMDALGWLEGRFGKYEPAVEGGLLRSGKIDEIFKAERALQSQQVEMALALAEQYAVDVLVINLMLLDHLNHKMPEMAQVEEGIRQMDKDLQRLLDGFAPDVVLAISDHGSRRVKGDFLLHAWLRDNGYLRQVAKPLTEQTASLNWLLYQAGVKSPAFRALWRTLIPQLPDSLTGRFWAWLEKSVPFAREQVLLGDEIDGRSSQVLLGGAYSSVIYWNLAGREPTGIVPPHERPRLTAELREKLLALRDPETGEAVVTAVYTPAELYTGPMDGYAPDLILDTYQSGWNILSSLKRGGQAEKVTGRYFVSNSQDFGHHSRNGIYIFQGAPFPKGQNGPQGHVMDIPATLLQLYDVPLPQDWDGRCLTDTFTPDFVAAHPPQTQPGDAPSEVSRSATYTAEETDQLVDHLRALGYMD